MERMDLMKEVTATIRAMNRYCIAGWNEDQVWQCMYPDSIAFVPTISGWFGRPVHILYPENGDGSDWSVQAGSNRNGRGTRATHGIKNPCSACQDLNATGINGHMINT
jgi:hypothetical protein